MNETRSVTRGARTPLLLACALLGATLFTAAPAHAFTPEYELGAFGGLHVWDSDLGLGRYRTDSTPSYYSSPSYFGYGAAFGIRLDLGLHPRFGLEGELALMPTSAQDNPTQLFGLGYRVHALINLLTGRVRPFLLFGGGGLTVSSSDPAVIYQATTVALDAGVGLKIDIKPDVGLRLDGRLVMVPNNDAMAPWAYDGEVLLGLYGRFGSLKGGLQPPADDDGDGIANTQDQCPKLAGPLENKGCPLDSDGDGIPDEKDKCPYDKGSAELKGCPNLSVLDSDGDGIFDDKDKCVDVPETKNGYLDHDGCPDTPPPAALMPFYGTIVGVNFEAERADLTPASLPILDRAIAALREHSTFKLEIAGYTDNSGDPVSNRDLSQKRADSVKAYMIAKGIEAARLSSMGFGQESPLFDNATPEGREKNRRVEFHFLN